MPTSKARSSLVVLVLALGAAFVSGRLRSTSSDETGASEAESIGPSGRVVCADSAPGDCREASLGSAVAEELRLHAREACRETGYLCADLERQGELRIMRWPEGTKRLTVRIPLPPNEEGARARALQRAAARGVRAWQGHPFELVVDDRQRPRGAPDIEVRWVSVLGGDQLGGTRVDWRRQGSDVRFRVLGLTLSTRRPGHPEAPLEQDQVMLTAAHEMGHALGLPHSDDPHDVMYPRNTARSLSTRDYLTLEALYTLPNGALIR